MPCYVVEYLWHAVLGEPGLLPWRSEDTRLPLALRFEGGRDTRSSAGWRTDGGLYQRIRPHLEALQKVWGGFVAQVCRMVVICSDVKRPTPTPDPSSGFPPTFRRTPFLRFGCHKPGPTINLSLQAPSPVP